MTPAGLGALVVVLMALLKRVDGPEGSRLKKWGDYIRANQFPISVGFTLVLGLAVGLIKYPGAEGQAKEVWSYILLLWGAVLTIYHTQKGVGKVLDGKQP
jgi:hypothetical protein